MHKLRHSSYAIVSLLLLSVLAAQSAFAAIAFDAASSQSFNNSVNVNVSHTIGGGTNRMLIVGIGSEETSNDDTIDFARYNGIDLIFIDRITVTSGNGFHQKVELYYLDESALPAAGSYNINVRTSGNTANLTVGAISLTGTQQGAPEAVAGSVNQNSSFIDTAITTLSNEAWVVDIVGSGNNGTFTAGPGQVSRWTSSANSSSASMSTLFVPTAGNVTPDPSQTHSTNSNRTSHLLVSIASDGLPVPPSTALAYYRLDESSWGPVIDTSGNGNDGSALGNATPASSSPVNANNPGTCGYADIPDNNSVNNQDAIDTGVDINNVGNSGTISFWYKSNDPWSAGNGDRTLFDASTSGNSDKYFHLTINNDGRLTFGLEDSADADFRLRTSPLSFAADQWVHVAVTWDLLAQQMQIFLNGGLAANRSITSTGVLGALNSLYIGDNRTNYIITFMTANSANGSFDEVRIYDVVQTGTQIAADSTAVHTCPFISSTCGFIPNTYPLFSNGDDLDIDDNVSINNGSGTFTVEEGNNNGNALDVTGSVGDVISANQGLPQIQPTTFPATGTVDVTIPNNGSQIINSAVQNSFDEIDVRNNATANFTGGGTFFIDRIRARESATINFDSGIYFIDQFDITDDNVTININGNVRIYIGTRFRVFNNDDNVSVNNGGSVEDLVTFLYPNAEFRVDGENFSYTGVIYGPQSGNIEFDDNATITGAIIGGDQIQINEGGQITYTPAVAAAVSTISTCLEALDHYSILHSGTGITCAPTIITITAHGSGHTATVPPAGTVINLATSTNLGTWSLFTGNGTLNDPIPNDGLASYAFLGNESSIQLAFNHFEVAPAANPVNFAVFDGTFAELEDPDLIIERAGFVFSTINTQIAGKPSDVMPNAQVISLQALRASDNDPAVCIPGFPDGATRTVDLAAECNDSATCNGVAVNINGSNIATNNDNAAAGTATYTPVDLVFGANATTNLVLNYADAGQISLHAKYNFDITNPADVMNGTSGSSNPFVVRPFAIRMSVADNPGVFTVTEGTGIFADAGENFDMLLEAVVWQQADDTDNDGIADNFTYTTPADFSDLLADNAITPNYGNESSPATATLTPTVVAPAGASDGTLSASSANFTNGASSLTTAWDEVGALTIEAVDTDYLGGGEDVAGTSAIIGRFHPAQYAITNAVITPALNAASCGAAQLVDYTYARQPFVASLTIEAQNTDGGRTENYQGDFATLSDDAMDATNIDNTSSLPLRNGVAGPVYDFQDASFVTDFDNGTTGEAVIDVALAWNMPLQAPTNSIVTAISPSNDDNDSSVGGTAIAMVGDGVDLNNLGITEVRFGRMRLLNAFGSEFIPLAIPLQIQEYDGIGFNTAVDDNCTTYDAANLTISLMGLTASGMGTVQAGLPNPANPIVLTAPGTVATANLTYELDADPTIEHWLEFNWDGIDADGDGNLFDDGPSATATFGIFGGNESTIFMREVLP